MSQLVHDLLTKIYNKTGGGEYNATLPTYNDGDSVAAQYDSKGRQIVTLGTAIAGEDLTNDLMKVEHQYSYSRKTADGQVKDSAGFVHTITISPTTATPTAGLLTVYDNTAESGTAIYTEWIFATTPGHTVTLDVACDTGIYVGYDATLADVAVTVSYR